MALVSRPRLARRRGRHAAPRRWGRFALPSIGVLAAAALALAVLVVPRSPTPLTSGAAPLDAAASPPAPMASAVAFDPAAPTAAPGSSSALAAAARDSSPRPAASAPGESAALRPSPAASPLPRVPRAEPLLVAGDYLAGVLAPRLDPQGAAVVDEYAGVGFATLPAHVDGLLDSLEDSASGYVVAVVGVHDLNDSAEQFAADAKELVRAHPERCVVWVTTHHMDYGFAGLPINAFLAEWSSARRPVVRWDELVAANSALVNADGRLPTWAASEDLAERIRTAGRMCAA